MSTAVKPSASPTLVRTQDLPPPAKTARSLRKRGPAGRFPLVPPCVIVCRRRSSRSNRYGHIADSVRAEGAVRGTACFADPRPFCPVTRAPGLPRLTGACRASRRPVLRRSAPAGRRAGPVRACGRGRLPDRPASSHHGAAQAVTGARRPPPDRRLARAVPWPAALRAGLDAPRAAVSCRRGVPGALPRDWIWLSWSCACRGPVMYFSWTRRIPALVTRRITRPQGPVAAAVSEVPGRLTRSG